MSNIQAHLPYLQVGTAVAPFVAALTMRFLMGGNRLTSLLLSVTVTWFTVNVLLSPFTDLTRVSEWFR